MVFGINVAGVVMVMMVVAMVISVNVAGVMIVMMVVAMVFSVNVADVRRVITVDAIATSDDFSRRSHRKSGKNESNENFELHICLEY